MKRILILHILLLANSIVCAQVFNVFGWDWAISKEKGSCQVAVDVDDMFYDFESQFQSRVLQKFPLSTVRAFPSDKKPFFKAKKDEPKNEEYSFLGFVTCELGLVGVRVFVYSHERGRLKYEFRGTTNDALPLSELVEIAADSIFLNLDDKKNYASPNSNYRFNEAIRPSQVKVLYDDHIRFVETKEFEPYKGKPNKLKDVIIGLKSYLTSEDYSFLEEVRECLRNNPRARCARLAKRYPKFYAILKAVNDLESYRRAPAGAPREQFGKTLRATVDEISNDDEPLSNKEKVLFEQLPVSYDTLARRFTQAMRLVLNCQKVLNAEYSSSVKEISMYMTILTNEDVSPILVATKSDGQDCYSLKDEARKRISRITNTQQSKYRDTLRLAEQLFENSSYYEAALLYQKANKYVGQMSALCRIRIEQCKKSPVPDNVEIPFLVSLITNDFDNVFNRPSRNGPLSENFEVNVENSTIIFDIGNDEFSVDALLKEVYYYSGSYKSRYKEEVETRIAAALVHVYSHYGQRIRSVNMDYIGSSDGAGFKSKGKLKVEEKGFKDMPNVEVVEHAIFDESFEGLRPPMSFEKEKFSYNDLYHLKAKREGRVKHGGKSGELLLVELPISYAKNLQLAYLRAKLRHENIIKLIGDSVPIELFTESITAQVFPEKGDIYRSVQMKISIHLKDKENSNN